MPAWYLILLFTALTVFGVGMFIWGLKTGLEVFGLRLFQYHRLADRRRRRRERPRPRTGSTLGDGRFAPETAAELDDMVEQFMNNSKDNGNGKL